MHIILYVLAKIFQCLLVCTNKLLNIHLSIVRLKSVYRGKRKLVVIHNSSAIGQHLINNPDWSENYNFDNFRTISNFYLKTLEAIYILCLKPVDKRNLCIRPFCFFL